LGLKSTPVSALEFLSCWGLKRDIPEDARTGKEDCRTSIFEDEAGKMNRLLNYGAILRSLNSATWDWPQGRRPSFDDAAPPTKHGGFMKPLWKKESSV
jgi:D-Tyr-tRNAtyr deacylase